MTFTPDTEGVWLNLPESVYRAAPGVSQTELKRFGRAATPLHFKSEPEKEPTDDMLFGRVIHTAVLEPSKLADAYHLRPDTYGKDSKPWHGGAAECKKWLADHADRPVLTRDQVERIPKIVERLKRLEEFSEALENGQTEVSYFKRDEATGLILKCRCDLVVSDTEGMTWVWDLKKITSGRATPSEFGRQCDELAYSVQAASYLYVSGATCFIFVALDDDAPYDAVQYEPDGDFINIGWRQYRLWLAQYAECIKTGIWPGYPSGINTLALPRYAVKRFEQ